MIEFLEEFMKKNLQMKDYRWEKLSDGINVDCVAICKGVSIYRLDFEYKKLISKGHRHHSIQRRLKNTNIKDLINMITIEREQLVNTYLKFPESREFLTSLFGDILTTEQKRQLELEEENKELKKKLENCENKVIN